MTPKPMKRHDRIMPVIMRNPRQASMVDRLVEHCHKLDGTKVEVIETKWDKPVRPHTRDQADAALFSLHEAAAAFTDRPFLWLEVDAIPIQPGWVKALTKQFYASKQQFLMSSDCKPPNILVGGIGIYGPNTSWLIPKEIQKEGWGWDLWMMTYLSHMIAFTPSIQHRYCAEFHPQKRTTIRENEFPRDQKIMRPDALIFHADKGQTLIGGAPLPPIIKTRPPDEKTFRHSGDMGDIIAALPVFRQLGGGRIIICDSITQEPGLVARESLKGARFEAIKPLLEAQPYITEAEWSDTPTTTTHDAWAFRNKLQHGESLAHAQGRHLGLENLNISKWITIPGEPLHNLRTRVAIYRSPRYHVPEWDKVWAKIAQAYGDKLLFVGLKEEHEAMEKLMGLRIEHAVTPDLLEAARVINACSLVYGNQTCGAWLTMGLHKRYVQETDLQRPNSRIDYAGAFYAGESRSVEIVIRALDKVIAGNG